MPPKSKITEEMVIDAAFALAREQGEEGVNVRSVAQRLGCSTQPVMYHFAKVKELRRAVYRRADAFHTEYISRVEGEEPMLETGLRYIRFAAEERHLFRLLFQSGEFSGRSVSRLMDEEEASPLLALVEREGKVSAARARDMFRPLFLCVHGLASLLANNAMEYDEAAIAADLRRIWEGLL